MDFSSSLTMVLYLSGYVPFDGCYELNRSCALLIVNDEENSVLVIVLVSFGVNGCDDVSNESQSIPEKLYSKHNETVGTRDLLASYPLSQSFQSGRSKLILQNPFAASNIENMHSAAVFDNRVE